MKRTLIILYMVCAAAPILCAQSVLKSGWESWMAQIAQNNTTLKALHRQMQASVLANGSNLCLPDPEAEVAYLVGTPKGVPNRTNVSLTQSLDWDVLLGRRRALAKANNQVTYNDYRRAVQQVLTEADEQFTTLVYYNKLCGELSQRQTLAEEIERLYQQKFERGDINQLEVNKVRLNASVSRADWARANNDRQQILANLQRLNGGQTVAFTDTVYPLAGKALPPLVDFQSALAGSLAVQTAQAAVAQSEAEIKVAKAEGLPALTVGFQGEYIKQNNYSGLSLGFSVPLWGNSRKKIRKAEAELAANRLTVDDVIYQERAQVAKLYVSAQQLQQAANALQKDMQLMNNNQLLRRSLELGQISLLDYLLELSFYYTARTSQLEAERDAQLAVSALRSKICVYK
uniref:TolC family protein n=1 Tax=Alloprevotella sp. TaxID=1872471 RepID=UPI003FEE7860